MRASVSIRSPGVSSASLRPGSFRSRRARRGPSSLLVLAIVAAFLWLPSPIGWIVVGIAAVIEVAETGFWLWYSKRRRARVGAETMIGRTAVVVLPCYPDGQVKLDGELWQARCEAGAGTGTDVIIRGLEGLTLVVEVARD
jgi:membrane protein implicated in regulation of membrane protease activity